MKTLHYIIVLVGIIVLHSCTNKQTFPSNLQEGLAGAVAVDTVVLSMDRVGFTDQSDAWYWQLYTIDNVVEYFKSAVEIEEQEAVELYKYGYFPFWITGDIKLKEKKYTYNINPSGVCFIEGHFYKVGESARYLFQHFEGKKSQFNKKGVTVLSVSSPPPPPATITPDFFPPWCLSEKGVRGYFECAKELENSYIAGPYSVLPIDIRGTLIKRSKIYYYEINGAGGGRIYTDLNKENYFFCGDTTFVLMNGDELGI